MSQSPLVSDWVTQFTDPFAVLGISVTADDRRVQKRYRAIAMRLHPDRFIDADDETKDLTGKLLARIVNPAYEKINQQKERKEHIALLRLKVRKLLREGPLNPSSEMARQLVDCAVAEVDVFYEQAIAQLADRQLDPHHNFAPVTQQMMELNLVYLQLKMGDLGGGVQEKRTGLIAAQEAKPIQYASVFTQPEAATESYDQRHYRRAQEYAKKGAWNQVVQELKDAIKIKADKSEYHSLLGIAYLNLEKPIPGMAKAYFKRALELNPEDRYALKFGPKLGLTVAATPPPSSQQANGKQPAPPQNGAKAGSQPSKRGGLFGLFGK